MRFASSEFEKPGDILYRYSPHDAYYAVFPHWSKLKGERLLVWPLVADELRLPNRGLLATL